MRHKWLKKIVITFLVVLILLTVICSFFYIEDKLLWRRGYGLITRPLPPTYFASMTLYSMKKFCHKYIIETHWKLPDVNTIIENVPEIDLFNHQPYIDFGIYILRSRKSKQLFLYSPINLQDNLKLISMQKKLAETINKRPWLVVACVKAMREDPCGIYLAYQDYPSRLKEIFGLQEWQTWCFIVDGMFVDRVQSDTPPIPGCLAHISTEDSKLGKFYYPEEILPKFNAIYPNATIPETQILR